MKIQDLLEGFEELYNGEKYRIEIRVNTWYSENAADNVTADELAKIRLNIAYIRPELAKIAEENMFNSSLDGFGVMDLDIHYDYSSDNLRGLIRIGNRIRQEMIQAIKEKANPNFLSWSVDPYYFALIDGVEKFMGLQQHMNTTPIEDILSALDNK
jgi:hypothetical protein